MDFEEEDLPPVSTLCCHNEPRVVVQGSVYFIETTPNRRRFAIASHPANQTQFPFSQQNVQSHYTPLNYLPEDAGKVFEEWEEVIDDFSDRDHISEHIK